MIARYYGKDLSLQMLRKTTQIGKAGSSLLGISESAETVGFRSHAVQLPYQDLVEMAVLPCILYWNQEHFVVLYKVRKNKLLIADPAVGRVAFTPKEFIACWTGSTSDDGKEGIALLLEPTPAFYERAEDNDMSARKGPPAIKTIFNYLRPYRPLVYQLLFGMVVGSVLQLLLPFLTRSVVDVGVNMANIHFIYLVLAAQLALITGRLLVDTIRSWILLHISSRIDISILMDFLIKLMRLPVAFFDTKNTGDLLQRMDDHQRIESFLTGASMNVLFSATSLLVFSIVLVTFNPTIFFVFISTSVFYSFWILMFQRQRRVIDYKRFDIASKERSATIQLIQGMQEIKLYGVERPMRWNWERLRAGLFRLNAKALALNLWQQSGALFINEGKNIFITFLSAKAVIEGRMTLGSMLAVQYIIGQLNSPIEQMIGFVQSWQSARISMDRLTEVQGMQDEESSVLKPFRRPATDGFEGSGAGNALIFSNVSFTYPGAGNKPVLKNITVSLPLGRTTAIVGVSGSGKTTLLKLLLKFYDPQQGEITLNGASLAGISHGSWRECCGVVMQESYIFSDSILKNIAVGAEAPDMIKMHRVLRIANINEFVESLPLGLDTKIGAEGMVVSTGQKQRILIARAIYRDPDFIFLDEATNSLDANNESEIVQNLAVSLRAKTVVVVAHRLSTVKNADQIIVLNKGAISERGTHQELIDLKKEYYTLVKNQLELGE